MSGQEKRTWGRQIVRHAGAIGSITGLMLGVVGVPFSLADETWRREYWPTVLVHAGYWILILYLVWILLSRPAPEYFGIPKAKVFRNGGLLLVEHAPWLSLGVMTAIYILEDNLERLVCVGEVINVQTNGLVQIQTRQDDRGFESEAAAWRALEGVDKEKILIKPGLYRRGR